MLRLFPTFSLWPVLSHGVCFCMAVTLCFFPVRVTAQVTLLVPSQPSIEVPIPKTATVRDDKRPESASTSSKSELSAHVSDKGKEQARAERKADDSQKVSVDSTPNIDQEVDVLITMMRPFRYEGLDMDMPQLFAVFRYGATTPAKDGVPQPERRDLLGDVEEIRYLDHKAWGANVALTQPGLYQFVIEGRPWWDTSVNRFLRHYVKTIMPVYGVEYGWDLPVGQRFEIVPLSRPFGLMTPALFTAKALLDGNPLPSAPVRMARINMEKRPVPTSWHEEQTAKTNAQGEFAFILNQPGWWCCVVDTKGDPLKGPDGQPKPLQVSAVFWLFVDGTTDPSRKR
ncbi:MAG: DUF4198 domain-containing protein [Desulfovibrio sp.]|nr:DUF4198 domain-containing protein [Desulfovibrio sp.]